MLGAEHLPEERVVRLLGTLLGSFVRTDRSPGYLLSVPDGERQSALARVSSEARTLGGALVYCALRPSAKWRDYLFAWQPALVAGLDLGVFDVSGQSCDVVERLIGNRVSEVEIRDRLQWAAAYIDDENWAARQERDLGFEDVRLTRRDVNRRFGVTLQVSDDGASLDDARVVSLVRQALAYRKTDGAIVELGEQTRLSVKLGEPVWARIDEQSLCTSDAVDLDDLAELERQGVSFARILVPAEQVAS